jgi:hypothetical protein
MPLNTKIFGVYQKAFKTAREIPLFLLCEHSSWTWTGLAPGTILESVMQELAAFERSSVQIWEMCQPIETGVLKTKRK